MPELQQAREHPFVNGWCTNCGCPGGRCSGVITLRTDTEKRHPDEILTDYDDGCRGLRDIDMREVLWEVIDDVIDSVALALESHERVDDFIAHDILTTVRDYVANNYGDD